MDNAKYQRCKMVQEYAASKNIEILFLPLYSPNLNIIERLWKLVKTECLRNKYFPDLATFQASIDGFLNSANLDYQRQLESLLTLKFQFFPIPKK
jgi:transposase